MTLLYLPYTIKRYKLNDRTYPLAIFMVSHFTKFGKFKGSYLLSPAQGKGGARATIQNVSAPPSAEQIKLSREGESVGQKSESLIVVGDAGLATPSGGHP